MTEGSPGESASGRNKSRRWPIAIIAAVLAVDYATILRIEIFAEIKNGKSFLEAVTEGNPYLGAIGILISIVGVAWIMYLLAGQGRGSGG